jgi:hypothetical protein
LEKLRRPRSEEWNAWAVCVDLEPLPEPSAVHLCAEDEGMACAEAVKDSVDDSAASATTDDECSRTVPASPEDGQLCVVPADLEALPTPPEDGLCSKQEEIVVTEVAEVSVSTTETNGLIPDLTGHQEANAEILCFDPEPLQEISEAVPCAEEEVVDIVSEGATTTGQHEDCFAAIQVPEEQRARTVSVDVDSLPTPLQLEQDATLMLDQDATLEIEQHDDNVRLEKVLEQEIQFGRSSQCDVVASRQEETRSHLRDAILDSDHHEHELVRARLTTARKATYKILETVANLCDRLGEMALRHTDMFLQLPRLRFSVEEASRLVRCGQRRILDCHSPEAIAASLTYFFGQAKQAIMGGNEKASSARIDSVSESQPSDETQSKEWSKLASEVRHILLSTGFDRGGRLHRAAPFFAEDPSLNLTSDSDDESDSEPIVNYNGNYKLLWKFQWVCEGKWTPPAAPVAGTTSCAQIADLKGQAKAREHLQMSGPSQTSPFSPKTRTTKRRVNRKRSVKWAGIIFPACGVPENHQDGKAAAARCRNPSEAAAAKRGCGRQVCTVCARPRKLVMGGRPPGGSW